LYRLEERLAILKDVCNPATEKFYREALSYPFLKAIFINAGSNHSEMAQKRVVNDYKQPEGSYLRALPRTRNGISFKDCADCRDAKSCVSTTTTFFHFNVVSGEILKGIKDNRLSSLASLVKEITSKTKSHAIRDASNQLLISWNIKRV
jgi:hypothetical protein